MGIELAKVLGGEVINADAMQMYQGLDISTNKATEEEMEDIPHHLLGYKDPQEHDMVVHDFIRDAVQCIDDIHRRSRVPIIVGGTHYYIQSLLWENCLSDIEQHKESSDQLSISDRKEIAESLDRDIACEMHQLLAKYDTVMAERWHANDSRKIRRSLEFYLDSGGQKHSDHIKHSLRSVKQRFDVLIFCLQCPDKNVLVDRLNQRIDKMIDNGLMEELQNYFSRHRGEELDFTRGILQTIGPKQFHQYFHDCENDDAVSKKRLFESGKELMNIATRQYAQKQIKWIRNRLLPVVRQSPVPFYILATDFTDFDVQVIRPAQDMAMKFINDEPMLSAESTLPEMSLREHEKLMAHDRPKPQEQFDNWRKHWCTSCNVSLNGTAEWQAHLSGRGHKKNIVNQQNKLPAAIE